MSMTIFEDKNIRAIEQIVGGLIKSFSSERLVVFCDHINSSAFPNFSIPTTFAVEPDLGDEVELSRGDNGSTLVVQIAGNAPVGRKVTPKWMWDFYEGGATILRLGSAKENISNPFLRQEALAAFDRDVSLPPITSGLMVPPIYSVDGILAGLYNKRITDASKKSVNTKSGRRPIAILAVYNERDVIEEALRDLLDQECDVIVLDNWSSDGSYEIVEGLQAKFPHRLLKVQRFPAKPTSKTSLTDLIAAKEELAAGFQGRWIINADADEFRRSPFEGLNLAQALDCAERYGANRINFTVLNFRPVEDGTPPVGEYRTHFRYFELPDHPSYFVQGRAWLQPKKRISLAKSAGHIAEFEGAVDFPLNFWMKHIPIRSQIHAAKKISGERAKRWSDEELTKGWHTHYAEERNQSYIWRSETLHNFDSSTFKLDFGVTLSTALALYYSPIRNGYRSEMRRWMDYTEIESLSREVADLSHRQSILRDWIKSLDLGSEREVLDGYRSSSEDYSLKAQLNNVLREMIERLPDKKRWPWIGRKAYHTQLLSRTFFRNGWYVARYPDVAISGMSPAAHYLAYGAQEGRDPTCYFNTLKYLSDYPDVAASGMNPLLHFVLYGAREGRSGVHKLI
ncbi:MULTISPECIES: glycosyltransferase [unclassified Rhizobium]|uniref:glycosyltransferase family 2 protein n=1 Tax=unclassified Rhizobium TaxID=2613769 RepID=UPI0013C4DBC6|nr:MULTISPECIES: glycosyltransferase [unclassified Rhizobium]